VASHDEIAPFQSTATTSRNRYPAQSGRPAHSGVPGFRSSPIGLPYRHDDRTNARRARRDSPLDNRPARTRIHASEHPHMIVGCVSGSRPGASGCRPEGPFRRLVLSQVRAVAGDRASGHGWPRKWRRCSRTLAKRSAGSLWRSPDWVPTGRPPAWARRLCADGKSSTPAAHRSWRCEWNWAAPAWPISGDTEWTPALAEAAHGRTCSRWRPAPWTGRSGTTWTIRRCAPISGEIRARRIVLTHMSGAITRLTDADLPAAYDGMTADL
jgi:hypothetical protein